MDLEKFTNAVLREALDMVGRSFGVRETEKSENSDMAQTELFTMDNIQSVMDEEQETYDNLPESFR